MPPRKRLKQAASHRKAIASATASVDVPSHPESSTAVVSEIGDAVEIYRLETTAKVAEEEGVKGKLMVEYETAASATLNSVIPEVVDRGEPGSSDGMQFLAIELSCSTNYSCTATNEETHGDMMTGGEDDNNGEEDDVVKDSAEAVKDDKSGEEDDIELNDVVEGAAEDAEFMDSVDDGKDDIRAEEEDVGDEHVAEDAAEAARDLDAKYDKSGKALQDVVEGAIFYSSSNAKDHFDGEEDNADDMDVAEAADEAAQVPDTNDDESGDEEDVEYVDVVEGSSEGAECSDDEDNINGEEDDVDEEDIDEDAAEATNGIDAEEDKRGEEEDIEFENVAEGAPEDIESLDAEDDKIVDGSVALVKEENIEYDSSMYMRDHFPETRKQKQFQVYVGGLHKDAIEDDLANLFGVYGEIQSVKIVRHPLTQKSKGFAFIRYIKIEDAKRALVELKEGSEIKGKQIKVSAREENDTLYVGNICKTWTKDQVMDALKSVGIEQIETVLLPADPKVDGKCKGYAFVEFNSHDDAIVAFQRLQKPDVVFGCDKSAKVSFSLSPLHPSEEALLQIKTVFIEGLPKSWDEEKINGICRKFGDVEKLELSKKNSTKKKKYYGFVTFITRDGAIACLNGINNAHFGEGDIKVKASLAKPHVKRHLAKQGIRGGFKVEKEKEKIIVKGNTSKETPARVEGSKKGKSLPKLKPNKKDRFLPNPRLEVKSFPAKHVQTSKHAKGKKHGGRGGDGFLSERPLKKARIDQMPGNARGRPNLRPHVERVRENYVGHRASYPFHFSEPSTSRKAYGYPERSGSSRRRRRQQHSDFQPHAGYIPAPTQVQTPYLYEETRADVYDRQHRIASSYTRGVAAAPQSSYAPYRGYASYEVDYTYPGQSSYAPRGPYYYR